MRLKWTKCIDRKRCWELISGIFGIHISFFFTSVIISKMQALMTQRYENSSSGYDRFQFSSAFLAFSYLMPWLIGLIICQLTIRKQERVEIPEKNSFYCSALIIISVLTFLKSFEFAKYSIIMIANSSSLITITLIGVIYSRVRDKNLKLRVKNIVVGVFITIGIVLFRVYDPALVQQQQQKQTQITGIILLIIYLLANGFLPDFLAEIKSQFKPKPIETMTQINKWATIFSIVYAISLGQFIEILSFLYDHHVFALQMLLMGVLSTVGEMFVYRMIKQFKQHFPPLIIITRNIFVSSLDISLYNHQTNILQLFGLFLVLSFVIYEFVSELNHQRKQNILEKLRNSLRQSTAQDTIIIADFSQKPQENPQKQQSFEIEQIQKA